MSVEKRNGKYLVRWRDSSGQQRSKSIALWRDAVLLDGEMKRKKAMGELITHERGKIRLDDFWELWWQRYALVHLTSRSRDVYARLYRRHVRPVLGEVGLVAVTRESVADLSSKLNKSLRPSSVRKVLAILSCLLARGVEWSYLATNPVVGVRKPKLVQREGRALTPEEVTALRAELDLRSSTIVAVLAGTGMRPGELRALVWGTVGRSWVHIINAVSNNEVGPTKTNRRRSVDMEHFATRALDEWNLANVTYASGFVFPGADGRLWTDGGYRMWQRKVFAPAAKRAGLAGVVPYDLRHTYASQRIAAGADILTLARSLGHSPTMTLTVYGHLLQGGQDAASTAATSTQLRDRL